MATIVRLVSRRPEFQDKFSRAYDMLEHPVEECKFAYLEPNDIEGEEFPLIYIMSGRETYKMLHYKLAEIVGEGTSFYIIRECDLTPPEVNRTLSIVLQKDSIAIDVHSDSYDNVVDIARKCTHDDALFHWAKKQELPGAAKIHVLENGHNRIVGRNVFLNGVTTEGIELVNRWIPSLRW